MKRGATLIPMNRVLSLLFLFPLIAAAARSAPTSDTGDIPRFSAIADGLYRGGQPDEKGFQFLKDKGIKTVINLRKEDNSEQGIVEKLGMSYVHLPVDEARPWSKVPDGAINKYFELLSNPDNYPIFFHCRRGADRTGALAAMYRIARQSWDAKKAYNEARDVGMRWYFLGLKSQIYSFRGPVEPELRPQVSK